MQNSRPLISVIIPAYNAEKYIRPCIDSILANTYRDIEILCVDDGSTDRTGDITREYAKKDERIKPLHKANGGAASARNAGLAEASGRYIAFIDADDAVHPRYFEFLTAPLKQADYDMVFCDYKGFRNGEWPDDAILKATKYTEISDIYHDKLLRKYAWGRIFKKETINVVRFRPEILVLDDSFFTMEAVGAITSPKICFVDAPMYYYRHVESSVSNASNAEVIFRSIFTEIENNFGQYSKNSLLMGQALKWGLFYRWYKTACYGKNTARDINPLLLKIYKAAEKDCFTRKEKAMYRIFLKSHALYRLVRIKIDPSLAHWEKTLEREN